MSLTPQEEKDWMEACEMIKKVKGYIPAEMLLIPTFINLAESGALDIAQDDEFTFIASPGILDDDDDIGIVDDGSWENR
tara:strand:+ start:149 stop:385 length:237 start_codon:yes stop_codon:yes gene_type:complete